MFRKSHFRRKIIIYSLFQCIPCLSIPQMEEVAEAEAALIEREVAVEAARRAAAEEAAAAKTASKPLAAERGAAQEADGGARRSELGPACHVVPCCFTSLWLVPCLRRYAGNSLPPYVIPQSHIL